MAGGIGGLVRIRCHFLIENVGVIELFVDDVLTDLTLDSIFRRGTAQMIGLVPALGIGYHSTAAVDGAHLPMVLPVTGPGIRRDVVTGGVYLKYDLSAQTRVSIGEPAGDPGLGRYVPDVRIAPGDKIIHRAGDIEMNTQAIVL